MLATVAFAVIGVFDPPTEAGELAPGGAPPSRASRVADAESDDFIPDPSIASIVDGVDELPPPEAVGGVVQAVLVTSFQCNSSAPGCQTVNAVLKYDATTGAYLGPHVTGINTPTGMARHPVTGRLLVASRTDDLVNEYDMHTGAFIRTFVQPDSGDLNSPQGIFFHSNGNLLVTSSQTDGALGAVNGVIEYNGTTGEFVRVFIDGGFLGEGCGDERCLFGPNTIATGSSNRMYVTSGSNDLILEFNATTGAYVNYFDAGSLLAPNGLVVRPSNAAIRPSNLLVTSLYVNPANPADTHKVLEFDDITRELVTSPAGGVLVTGLETPGPLLFSDDAQLLIGDRTFWFIGPNYSDRVVKRNSTTGAFIANFTPINNFQLHYSTSMLRVQIGCLSATDCNDSNPCTDDVCNNATNTCSNPNDNTNNPNDGLFCNGTESSCNNGQIVYSMPPPNCSDVLSCTDDGCNEATDQCTHAALPGFCVIGGACVVDGAANPNNPCQSCNATANPNNWTNRPVGTLCGSTVNNDCDNPDTCTAAGVCLANFEPSGQPCGVSTDTTCTNPDTCNGSGTCLDNNAPNGTNCNDGLFCTTLDRCSNGFCFGQNSPCNSPGLMSCLELDAGFQCVACLVDDDCPSDGLFCTAELCDPMTHACMNVPDNDLCDDGQFCNGSETCNGVNGQCTSGSSPCSVGDPCDEMLDRCIECLTNGECNDGLFCTGPESCVGGECRSGTVVVNNGTFNGQTGWTNNTPAGGTISYAANNLTTTGPNTMTGGFTWASQGGVNVQGGLLEFDLVSYINLTDVASWDYPVVRIGASFYGLNANGTLSGPTLGDSDGAGGIDNGHPATSVHFAIDIEALVGPGAQTIGFGVCSVDGEFGSGTAIFDNVFGLINVGNPCPGACNEANDQCILCQNNNECTDGLFCNGAETCVAGSCTPGAAPCAMNQFCIEASDQCVNCLNNGNCDDTLFCNGLETCVGGSCQAGASPCLAGQMCDETNNVCTGCANNAQCDDNNICNGVETCQGGVCVPGVPIPNCCTSSAQCSNGTVCDGVETCIAGVCMSGTAPNCNDGRPCTTDSCHPVVGCQHANLPPGAPCGDSTNTPCNLADTCNPIGDCQSNVRPNGTPCPDGIICNGNETCQGGICQPGTPVPNCCDTNNDCNNGNPCDGVETCSSNQCAPGTPVPNCCVNSSDCNDGNVCDGIEMCVANSCVAGDPLVCNDGNPCTTDSCHPVFGCQSTNVMAGVPCGSSSNTVCDHPDTCNGSGICVPNLEPNGTPCPDGVVCNGSESCQAGVCIPGTPLPGCCTSNGECNNGSVCDGLELCVGNTCVPGSPLDCGDGNPCTDDLCNAATGCSHANNSLPCDDGDDCTALDACTGGQCVGGPPAGCDGPNCTDCDESGVRDDCETLTDCDGNDTPDACEPIGDGDEDCDVDLRDMGALQRCFRGANDTPPPGCFMFDVDDDGHVDLQDWDLIFAALQGP